MTVQAVTDGNEHREAARLRLFRALLAMRGAKLVLITHDHVTIQCLAGDEENVRALAKRFGITLDGVAS